MNSSTAFMIVAFAASLLACGKSDEVAAPATQAPVAEVTPTEAATAAPAEQAAPVVEPPPSEPAPAAAPAASPTPPETKAVQPAAASKPATVQSEPAAAASDLVHGQKIYVQACAYCHDRGIAGAPKTGDVAAWKVRTAQGMDSLYAVAVRGKGAMPAKGGNRSLSEADVKAAVDYMVAQSR